MYCSQQISIPINLPSLLKKFAKAAIRTQPYDLLSWAAAYFQAVADGLPPPVKLRLEYPPVSTKSGLTPGYLKVLLIQVRYQSEIKVIPLVLYSLTSYLFLYLYVMVYLSF